MTIQLPPKDTPATEGAVREVIIVGSGPAGYTAAVYAARANLEPLVFEGAVTAGGALMNTTDVENFPGFAEGIMGPELMMNMREQAERFGAELVRDDVVRMDLSGPVKKVYDEDDNEFLARSVILAMGSAYRELGLPDEKRLSGRGVSWCATCDGAFFRDQHVAVVGGGDTALQDALYLARIAASVTVIHRRDAFRASRIMGDRVLSNPKIKVCWDHVVDEVLDVAANTVTGVRVRNVKTGEITELPVQGLFIAIGHTPNTGFLKGQVELNPEGYIVTQECRTSVPGVFAAGDVQDNRYRQAITAAGSGCMAALEAERYLGTFLS